MAFFDKVTDSKKDLGSTNRLESNVHSSSTISSQNNSTSSFSSSSQNSGLKTSSNLDITKSPTEKELHAHEKDSVSSVDLSSVKTSAKLSEMELGSVENLLKDAAQGSPVLTELDTITKILDEHKGTLSFSVLASESGIEKKLLEKYLQYLEKGHLIEISYPANPFSSASISYLKGGKSELHFVDKELPESKKLIENYTVISNYVVADVNIWSIPFENTPIYDVVPHKLGKGSQALILSLVEEMARIIPVKLDDITDPRKMLELKLKFYDVAKKQIHLALPNIASDLLKILTGVLLHYSYGLGDMEIIMADNWLEEVAINGANQPISLYHRKFGWIKSTKKFASEQDIYNFSAQIGRKVGKQINNLFPIMDAHMLTGDRVAATLFPISTEGDTVTIRRFSRNPWTVVHMIDPKNHTMSVDMMAFLWMCIQYELNMLVVGGTASGKTSVLNTISSLIPPTNRIISIEDTREIALPDDLHWNWVPLSSRAKNAEGVGEVTMLDLMVASLRMRPDRIIVGEIRRKQQAEAMFEAMHTGHSVSATMHADTAEQVKRRLTQPPIEIPEEEIQALHLVIVQYRDRRRGLRRTLEIAELLPGSGEEKVNLNYLYRWRARKDIFEKDNPSIRVFEDLNLHTGMSLRDIEQDLEEKKTILNWMSENNIRDVNKVGKIMRIYYKYPKLLLDTIKDGGNGSNL